MKTLENPIPALSLLSSQPSTAILGRASFSSLSEVKSKSSKGSDRTPKCLKLLLSCRTKSRRKCLSRNWTVWDRKLS